jgi:phosphoenolpyruvate carboxykinase (ATP)
VQNYKTNTALDIVKGLAGQPNVEEVDHQILKKRARKYGNKTEFGNFAFFTNVRNRSAALTVYVGSKEVLLPKLNPRQEEILQQLPQTLEKLKCYLKKVPLVKVEQVIGNNRYFTPHCTLYFSVQRKDCIRVPFMWTNTIFSPKDVPAVGPKFNMIYIPEWPETKRQILVFPEEGVTFVLGSDYFGEVKKGFLRMSMWFAKKQGMLGIHAGSKMLKARDTTGKLRKYGMFLFGLSATGKTTHACHNHGLTGSGQGVEILQDDVIFWRKDGSALGTERGFFIKTDGLDPKTQALLYRAAVKKDTTFENVCVDDKGKVHFQDDTLTGNGRGIIQMKHLGKYAAKSIDLPSLHQLDGLIIAFITRRNTVLPIATKLTPAEAAAAFMLGESIETSAGDPRRAGESIRVVGTNPFIVGSKAEEGNIFYDFVCTYGDKVRCFLLNTGGMGEIITTAKDGTKVTERKVTRVEILEMAAVIRGIARGTIQWEEDPFWKMQVPKSVKGMDISRLKRENFYSHSKITSLVNQIKQERIHYLQQFKGLHPDIVKAVQ